MVPHFTKIALDHILVIDSVTTETIHLIQFGSNPTTKIALDHVLVIDSVTTDTIHLSQFGSNPTTRYSFGFISNRIFSTNLF